jgi:excisionase family DNA binding protein
MAHTNQSTFDGLITWFLEQQRTLVREELTQLLSDLPKQQIPITSDPTIEYLNIPETLKYLDLSKSTLRKLRMDGKIRETRSTDKRVMFRKSDLIAYLESDKTSVAAK